MFNGGELFERGGGEKEWGGVRGEVKSFLKSVRWNGSKKQLKSNNKQSLIDFNMLIKTSFHKIVCFSPVLLCRNGRQWPSSSRLIRSTLLITKCHHFFMYIGGNFAEFKGGGKGKAGKMGGNLAFSTLLAYTKQSFFPRYLFS